MGGDGLDDKVLGHSPDAPHALCRVVGGPLLR
jgi:hypothetical protein